MVGVSKPSAHLIVVEGKPLVDERIVETATNMIPGRLCTKGTASQQIIVCTATLFPMGWIGFEHTSARFRPADIATAHAANDVASVLYGGHFVVQGVLTISQTIVDGDILVPAAAGNLQKGTVLVATSGASTTPLAITGNYPGSGMPIARARESVTTDGSTYSRISVLSLI